MTLRRVVASGAALAALVGAGPAAASVRLTHVDTSSYPTIRATVESSAGNAIVPSVTENGAPVVGLSESNLGHAKAVVLAVDVSQSMAGKPLQSAIAAARSFVAAKPASDAVSIVEFGPKAILLSDLSTATIDADGALQNLGVAARSGTALYDAVELSAQELAGSPLHARVLIVLTDGRDVSSASTLAAAITTARKAGVAIYPIGLEGTGFDPTALQKLARSTGGRYHGTAAVTQLRAMYASIANQLTKTWEVSYVTAARPGDRLDLKASVAGAGEASESVVVPTSVGTVASGPAPWNLVPAAAYGGGGAIVVGLIAGLLVVAAVLLLIGSRRGSALRTRLDRHIGGAASSRNRRRERRDVGFAVLVRATEHAFGNIRQWKVLQTMLDRGETPLKTAELIYISAGAGISIGLLFAVAGVPAPVIILAMLIGGAVPFVVVWYRMRQRLNAFENQLPDLLITIAASLKAGHSFKQGIQAIVDEGHPPAAGEFKRVLTETGLGRQLDAALADMSERVDSENFRFAITAVTIQRQVGGSLASLFDMVADTVRQRQQFARKIRSLTAMGRMSAYTLVGLPFFIVGAISLLNRSYLDPLFHSSTGHLMLFMGLGMMAIGGVLLRKIVAFRG